MISGNFFVTGATGLIGTALCKTLVARGRHVVAFVRNVEKARARRPSAVELVVGDMMQPIKYEGAVDYIVHAASNTASKAFVEKPVEIIQETMAGAENALAFAREKKVKSMVFLSTMEVYGLTDSENVTEADYAALDPMSPRNCYPEAKLLAECLCASAAKEYGVPVKVARLTQTFGAGVENGDQRVFAQFAEAAVEGRDIILKSGGKTAQCYCALSDAISAILMILEKGEDGAAYNVANPDTFCTIREMADMVASNFSNGCSKVVVDLSGAGSCGYLPTFRMKLNVDRLLQLGWRPTMGLEDTFREMIAGVQN